jgi:hypothetical protein
MTYTYDPVGNRTKMEVNSGVTGTLATWTYDKTNQLLTEDLS